MTTTTSTTTSPPITVPPAAVTVPAAPRSEAHPDALDLPGLGTAVTALAAAAAASYLLGLLVLQQQLAQVGTLDAATAWQAALLVPRPFVVLQAARAVSASSALLVAGSTFAVGGIVPMGVMVARGWRALWSSRRRRGLLLAFPVLYLVVAAVVVALAPPTRGVPSWVAILTAFSPALGGSLVADGLLAGRMLSRRVVWGILVIYLSSLLVAYSAVVAQRPLLASAVVTLPGGRVQHGLYLAHADGYWWMIVQSGRRGVVLPIRDAGAASVMIGH